MRLIQKSARAFILINVNPFPKGSCSASGQPSQSPSFSDSDFVPQIRSIETFKIFDTIYIITAGGPGISSMSASMYAYQVGLRNFNVGKAAALCVIMLIFVLLVSQVIQRVQKARDRKLQQALAELSDDSFTAYSD